jgi:hypothetical protein
MKQPPNQEHVAYNAAVKESYFKVLKGTKQLLSSVFQHELRCTLQRNNRSTIGFGVTVHEVVSPLIYLSLECNDGERLSIHFGFELFQEESEYSIITSKFVRLLYKLTSVEHTAYNIEQCINTEYVINACSELYETIEDSAHKQHSFSLIAYRPIKPKRNRMQAVA